MEVDGNGTAAQKHVLCKEFINMQYIIVVLRTHQWLKHI